MDDNDILERITIRPSEKLERFFITYGEDLHARLMEYNALDELEALGCFIGPYTYAASCYGDKTFYLPESLGVDLGVAFDMKVWSVEHGIKDQNWQNYANDFRELLADTKERIEGVSHGE